MVDDDNSKKGAWCESFTGRRELYQQVGACILEGHPGFLCEYFVWLGPFKYYGRGRLQFSNQLLYS